MYLDKCYDNIAHSNNRRKQKKSDKKADSATKLVDVYVSSYRDIPLKLNDCVWKWSSVGSKQVSKVNIAL